METELILSRGGLPPLSARGCVQELSPISLGQFHRTLNGELIFLGVKGKKYRSVIHCEDQTVLASGDLIPGMEVDVSCIQRLWQKCSDGQALLERDPVAGSILVTDINRQSIPILEQKERHISLLSTNECFISYRPILNMRVISYALTTHEWLKKSTWRLELEEI